MKLQRLWGLLLFFASCCATIQEGKTSELYDSFLVYVLLDKKSCEHSTLWNIFSAKGFHLCDIVTGKILESLDVQDLSCALHKKGTLLLNGRQVAVTGVRIRPKEGLLVCNDETYPGDLVVIFHDDAWFLVNGVDLEEYVCGVLRCESYPTWELEANKSQAIAQRSYVVAKISKARDRRKFGKGFVYDIGKTNAHQTYKGFSPCEKTRKAVLETAGMILSFQGQPVESMYDICCGGVITAHMEGVNFQSAPYLARDYPCTYCSSCKLHAWKASYTLEEVEELLRAMGKHVANIKQIYVARSDKAGMVSELIIKSGRKTVRLSGKQVYGIFKAIRSFHYTVNLENGHVVFHGKGYGHHLGLCQYGAREMARQGKCSEDILRFYFPNIDILRIKILRTVDSVEKGQTHGHTT